jgi:hypothetical protein
MSRRDIMLVETDTPDVSSLRDFSAVAGIRKLKHTVNKVLSLRDLVADVIARP